MSERGWEGMGELKIAGAAKFGHIRKDLRTEYSNNQPSSETLPGPARTLRHIVRRVLEASGISSLIRSSPEEE